METVNVNEEWYISIKKKKKNLFSQGKQSQKKSKFSLVIILLYRDTKRKLDNIL